MAARYYAPLRDATHQSALDALNNHIEKTQPPAQEVGAIDRTPTRAEGQAMQSPGSEVEGLEAQRAAYVERLDGMVNANKIDAHEEKYRLSRFDNGHPAEADRASLQKHAAALEALNQHIDRGGVGQTPEQAADIARKPDEIER